MEYLDATLERGFDVDEVAPYWSFVTGLEMDFFEAVAKLRAYQSVGVDAFILSGYTHRAECDLVAEHVLPRLDHGPLPRP